MKPHIVSILALGASPVSAGLISSLIKQADSSSWQPARETSLPSEAEAGSGIGSQKPELGFIDQSPKPTAGPQVQLVGDNLFKRIDGYTMAANTCGFEDLSNLPITCLGAGAQCSNSGDYRGCCGNSQCKDLKTACIDFATNAVMGSCNSLTDSHTVCCTSILQPFCYTYLFSDTDAVRSVFVCNTDSGSAKLYDYPPSLSLSGSDASATGGSAASDDSDSSSVQVFTTLDSSGATVTVTRDRPSASSSSSSSSGSGSSTPTGAIIGGAVGGGIVLIGALAFGVFFFLRRSRQKASPSAVAQNLPPQNQQPHYPPQALGSTAFITGAGAAGSFSPHSNSPPPPNGYGQPTSPSSMTYASTTTSNVPQGYAYPPGYVPPGQGPYATAAAPPAASSHSSPVGTSSEINHNAPHHTPSPPSVGGVPPPALPARVPAVVELGTHHILGSHENRAELN
ncbi:hypothetical protein CFIMG_004006RA [Ceratocystis fimbriata CBS 114723]|uniref:Uncharacterized protein n=1 Tax=Ceratocystis fimbriata CBS 114723 TaxID=1035309 RepID=A0A2C5WPB0_9PEZI|nr:hypothetical protein CFIMG_004006RA [Ceratocystis fimbriata CBS 114723]